MSKARDLANAGTALGAVTATELGYVDGVTSAIQTQIDAKAPSSTAVTLTDTQTLTNKTLTNPVIASVVNNTLTTTTGDMIYASAANTPARLPIGSTDQVLKVTGGVPVWATPASGTITWTQRAAMGGNVNSIQYNGSNLYVAVGSGGRISTSPDGITWTARTSGTANTLVKVAYGNGLWVAVGYNGTLTTSTDGTTWTVRTSNMSTNDIYNVQYANSIWVAVGAGGGASNTGGIIYSTDGTTWTRKSQSLSVGSAYYGLAYNGTNWIVGCSQNTNNLIYASTPSGTWTTVQTGSSLPNHELFYDGTRTLMIDENGNIRFSTSTTIASSTVITGLGVNSTAGESRNFYYNGKIFSIGTYFMGFSTTPLSGNYANITNPSSLAPITYNAVSGASSNNNGTIFASAAGYIVGSTGNNGGQIFTSF